MNKQTQEVLIILQEECAEVIQAISKCFRFGLDNFKANTVQTNVQHLEEELGDLIAMMNILVESGIINQSTIDAAAVSKIQKLKKWSNIYE
jgi:NTP pyrophosphatase (non-canonical NTP hydrolase)